MSKKNAAFTLNLTLNLETFKKKKYIEHGLELFDYKTKPLQVIQTEI